MSGAESSRAGQEVTCVDAIRIALSEEMERDGRVILLGEDIGVYGGAFKATAGLLEKFGPARVIDTPVVEEAIVGAAIGASLRGLRPVVEMQFFDFAARAFDMITNFAAKHRYRTGLGVPIVIRGPSGGGVHAGPFHSQSPEGYFARTPGLAVVAPSTAADARGLLKAAIRDDDPVLFLEHKHLYRQTHNKGANPGPDYMVPFGKAKTVRPGRDATLVTYGATVFRSLVAARKIAEDSGKEVEVIDLRTLAPYDFGAIAESVKRTSRLLVVHEDWQTHGFGAEVAARAADELFERLDAPVRRVGAKDVFCGYAPQLEDATLPQGSDIEQALRDLLAY